MVATRPDAVFRDTSANRSESSVPAKSVLGSSFMTHGAAFGVRAESDARRSDTVSVPTAVVAQWLRLIGISNWPSAGGMWIMLRCAGANRRLNDCLGGGLRSTTMLHMANSVSVAELALRLHRSDKPDLRLELEPGTIATDDRPPAGYLWANDAIEFESLAARNRHVAEAAFSQLRERLNLEPNLLYEQAYELWKNEIGHPDQASGRLLGMAANALDILAIGSQRIRDGADVFNVLHLVEAALPYIDVLNHDSLTDLCEAKHELTRNDFAGGSVHGAIEAWLASRSSQAAELHSRVTARLTEASASLLSNAVVAIAKTDYATAVRLATADAHDDSPLLARVGAWTLGRLLLEQQAPIDLHANVAASIASLIETADADLRVQAVRAATNSMHSTSSFDAQLKRLAKEGDQEVLSGVATTLFMKAGEMLARGDIQEWLDSLTELTPEFKGAIDNLDNAMARLLTQPANVPMVVDTLTKWVAKHGRRSAIDTTTGELFSDTIHKLWHMEAEWSALVTNWLLSDRSEHPASLAGMLNEATHREPPPLRLNRDRLDALAPADLLFLARRMLGYVHDRSQATSLALSMLDSQDAKERIFPVLHALLVDEIGFDYPGSTVEACRAASEACAAVDTKEFLRRVSDKLEQMNKALSDLPRVNELRPPMKLRRQFALARAKQMGDSLAEARKKSVWRMVATEIPIKAGRGTFSYRDAAYGPPMQMSTLSHSIELPRREAFDPIGNAIRHLGFRLAKRDES